VQLLPVASVVAVPNDAEDGLLPIGGGRTGPVGRLAVGGVNEERRWSNWFGGADGRRWRRTRSGEAAAAHDHAVPPMLAGSGIGEQRSGGSGAQVGGKGRKNNERWELP
jgi:hypothetical protein